MMNQSLQQWTKTRVSSRLGIELPIIQGPLGGLQTQQLTAAVSKFGGLGSFGAHGLAPSAIGDVIAEIRSLTKKPFAMNLWVSMEDKGARTSGRDNFSRARDVLSSHIHSLGGTLPIYKPYTPIRFEDQMRVLLDARVPAFSFIAGIPPREILEECHAKNIVVIGTATIPEEAIALEQAGVDLIVASGFEAGGHRGSFLLPAEESLTGTFSLTPQVADAVSIPVIAAGGIGDARGIVAALALGAEGVQLGTAFLACEDSGASRLHREAILSGKARRTGLTRGFTGRLARGIHNQLMAELNRPGVEILPYPLQRYLVKNLTALAAKRPNSEFLQLWAGQSASLSQESDEAKLLQSLLSDLSSIAGPVQDWHRNRKQRHPDRQRGS